MWSMNCSVSTCIQAEGQSVPLVCWMSLLAPCLYCAGCFSPCLVARPLPGTSFSLLCSHFAEWLWGPSRDLLFPRGSRADKQGPLLPGVPCWARLWANPGKHCCVCAVPGHSLVSALVCTVTRSWVKGIFGSDIRCDCSTVSWSP